jgi:hypothetical protein
VALLELDARRIEQAMNTRILLTEAFCTSAGGLRHLHTETGDGVCGAAGT